MPPVVPDPRKIKSFRTEAAFAAWMKANHARETELWIKVHKKASGLRSVTVAQALDIALCWGWIDGIRKSFDEQSFLQRYSPRRARSMRYLKNSTTTRAASATIAARSFAEDVEPME